MDEKFTFINKLPRFWLWFVLVFAIGTLAAPAWLPFVFPLRASLTDGANAVNIAGQLNGAVTYTEGRPNDGLTAIGLDSPMDVVVDETDHRMFVADCDNNRVVVYNLDASNALVDYTADNVLGQSDLTSYTDGASTSQSSLYCPSGLAFDDAGDLLYVADQENNRVMVFDVASIIDGENAVSVFGQTDFLSSDNGTTSQTFYNPKGLAFEEAAGRDELYVTDFYNNRVLVFDVDSITNGEPAVNVLGQVDFTSSDSGTTQGTFNLPSDVVLDSSSNLFVTDQNNNRVMVFDVSAISDGENASKVLGQSDFTTATAVNPPTIASLEAPTGLAYNDTNSWLFVGDEENSRVMVFDVGAITDGEDAVKVLGATDFITDDGGQTSQNYFYGVEGMFAEGTNNSLWVVDTYNNRVLNFDVTAITNGENAVNVAGQYKTGAVTYINNGTNNGPIATGLDTPDEVVVDTVNHRMFVSDGGNNRILVYNLDASDQLVDYTADFVLGQPDFITGSALIGPTQSTLNDPRGMDYDAVNNRLFVADAGNNRVLVFDVGSISNGENAVNVFIQINFTSTTWTGVPDSVAYDGVNERLYVSDLVNDSIMVFDVASISDGEGPVNFLGGLGLTASTMTDPGGVSIDTVNNRLFVADFGNNRVLVFDVASIINNESAVNVLGQVDFTSNTEACTQAGAGYGIHNVEYDSTNDRLYVSGEYRVMVYDVAVISDGENAVNVIGQSDFTTCGNGGGISQSSVSTSSAGLEYNPTSNRLMVADSGYNRIMMFDVYPNTAPTATTPTFSSQATDGSGYVTFTTVIDDGDDDDLKAKVEYSDDGGSTWSAPYLTSVSSAGVSTYTTTRHPFSYDGSDYVALLDSTGGVLFVYDNSGDVNADITDVTSNDQDISAIISVSPQTWNLALVTSVADPSSKYTMYVDDALFPDAVTTKAYLDSLGVGTFTVDFWADDVFVFSDGAYSYTAPVGPTVITEYQVGTPGITTVLGDVLATPDLTLSTSYTTTRHPFNYDSSDYVALLDSTGGVLFVYDNSGDVNADITDITSNDQDISAIISASPQTWNVALVTSVADPSSKYTMYVDDAKFSDSVTAKAYLDSLGVGLFTVDFWADDVFVFSGGAYSYTAPVGPTVITDYQVGTPTITTVLGVTYQIGSTSAISTASGANMLTVIWDTQAAANTSTAMDDTEQLDIQVRVTPNDSIDDGTVQTSASFTVDNLDPSGLTALVAGSPGETSMPLTWTAVTETNFNHYEIWYGESQSDVQGRSGTALEWDDGDDATLATKTTLATTITGLTSETVYYFKIWAIDDYGNYETVTDISATPSSGSRRNIDPIEPDPVLDLPTTPTIGTPLVLNDSEIEWNFVDNADNELGFELRDSEGLVVINIEESNLSNIIEDLLLPNTSYQRKVYAYNNDGYSSASALSEEVFTLATVPSISSSIVVGSNSVNLNLDTNENPGYTDLAIYESKSSRWVQADGSLGESKVYQTFDSWGGGLFQ